ncbi:MAG TPA: VOC family protein [Nitrososphaeraceae archaeon]|jgi:predicted 3-demethylubiquinone-9 3-methyltransferase (glyoxalase superfamily)|nr:VOC family protein [Nitrososphaeraceae archaeon]
MQKISPCLWFDDQGEEAAKFYTSIFKDSKIGDVTRYGKEGYEIHGREEGTVMTVEFEIEGQKFLALNGGPIFKFNEAISFQVYCETQEEVDYYWEKLSEGGDEKAQQCGWLKDKYGVSWQIVPTILIKMLKDNDSEKSQKVMKAMLQMHKLDISTLKKAYDEK